MQPTDRPRRSIKPGQRDKKAPWPLWLSTFLLAVAFVAMAVAVATRTETNWPEALLLLLATITTLATLIRQLPAQNVWFAAAIIALIGSAAHTFSVLGGIPLGPILFGTDAGPKIFGTLPWAMPLLWVVVVLNSRGVARLMLRPWRKTRTYGFWVIGITSLLTMLFDGALEPFATHTKHFWLWQVAGISLTPHGAPLVNSIGWFFVTALMLAFATPLLINKQLSKRSTPHFQPLAVWLGGILIFAISAGMNGLWVNVGVDAAIGIVATIFAVRGGRW